LLRLRFDVCTWCLPSQCCAISTLDPPSLHPVSLPSLGAPHDDSILDGEIEAALSPGSTFHYKHVHPYTALAEFQTPLHPLLPLHRGVAGPASSSFSSPGPTAPSVRSPSHRLTASPRVRAHLAPFLRSACPCCPVDSFPSIPPLATRFWRRSVCASVHPQGSSMHRRYLLRFPSPMYHVEHPPTSPLRRAYALPPPLPPQPSRPSCPLCAAGPPPQLNFVHGVLTLFAIDPRADHLPSPRPGSLHT
jgi:hypothetical protein